MKQKQIAEAAIKEIAVEYTALKRMKIYNLGYDQCKMIYSKEWSDKGKTEETIRMVIQALINCGFEISAGGLL